MGIAKEAVMRNGQPDPALYWDPYDVEIDTDPHGIWRRLRDEAPVYHNEPYDFFALSRFEDVNSAHRDPRTFSSAHGTVLELMGSELGELAGLIIFMDPPDHDVLRALVSRAFTPRRIHSLEERIREICREYLDPQVGSEGFDYVSEFAAQLPSRVISSLLGVPETDRPEVLEMIDSMFYLEPGVGMINDVSFRAQIDLTKYVSAQLAERRTSPRDDLFTALVDAEVSDGDTKRRLTDMEASGFANLLISAGTETVARLLGWAAVVLGDHPAQLAELAEDGALIPNAVEELLRFEAPSPVQGRSTTRDVTLHGEVIPRGSKVLLLNASAGRDERVYEDADSFDIHRRFDQHLSFGIGPHFCLGAALARLEGRVALEETLKRFPRWEVDRDRAVMSHTSTVRGYKEVPLVL